jgi:hypothetical protein
MIMIGLEASEHRILLSKEEVEEGEEDRGILASING